MTYGEALSYIHAVSWKGSRPGLERISELCSRLGEVQNELRFVHVAGTNGKGSTSAMIASVLRAAGYRVGLFTSPYILDFCERIAIDGEPISHDALCRAVEAVRPHADAMDDSPTEFELITAIAFVCFAEAKCDVVVLECGMGGRLDSTNVIPSPEVSVITNVALDHTAVLGDTVEAIAREKAGIIKDAPCVVGDLPKAAKNAIAQKCRERGVPLIEARLVAKLGGFKAARDGISFEYEGASLFVPLCGTYQENNVRAALAALGALRRRGWRVTDAAIDDGLRAVRWRGRFETLAAEPTVIFDGAHNPDGARGAAATLAALYPGERVILVSGVMADKDRAAIAAALAPLCDHAYTAAPDNPRALDPAVWASELCAAGVPAVGCESVADALRRAADDARRGGGIVFCAGSLYMYGEIAAAIGLI